MGYQTDVRVLTVSDENASDDNRIVEAARPDTTTGTGDNGKTTTITGTDVFGNSLSETITSTSSAEAVAGSKLFLTVSAVECSAKYAADIKVGSGTLCAQAIGGGARVRLKGMSITSGGTAGTISFINGTPETGTTLFKARTIGTANDVVDRTIPAEGLLFASGMSVSYTVDHADMMTFFFT